MGFKLILIRHGDRSDNNKTGIVNHKKTHDPSLSELGILQAEETGKFLAQNKYKIVKTYTSPYLRTIQTSYHMLKTYDQYFERKNNFDSRVYIENGIWEAREGKPDDDHSHMLKERNRLVDSYESMINPNESEDYSKYYRRIDDFVNKIIQMHNDHSEWFEYDDTEKESNKNDKLSISIVTHASVLTGIVHKLTNIPFEGILKVDNCGLFVIDLDTLKLEVWNYIDHFKDKLLTYDTYFVMSSSWMNYIMKNKINYEKKYYTLVVGKYYYGHIMNYDFKSKIGFIKSYMINKTVKIDTKINSEIFEDSDHVKFMLSIDNDNNYTAKNISKM